MKELCLPKLVSRTGKVKSLRLIEWGEIWYIISNNIYDAHQNSLLNPLRHKGDQHEFSLNNISTSSRENPMRINNMITNGKMLSFI